MGEGINYKIQKSQATRILQGIKPKPGKPLLLPAHFPSCPNRVRCALSGQFGKLGSRNVPSLKGREKAEGHCSTFLSSLWADGQQRLYIFQGSHFWEVAADGNVSEPHPLQERWAGLPPNIEAAAVSLESGDFYFFKGTKPGVDEKAETREKRCATQAKRWEASPFQPEPVAREMLSGGSSRGGLRRGVSRLS